MVVDQYWRSSREGHTEQIILLNVNNKYNKLYYYIIKLYQILLNYIKNIINNKLSANTTTTELMMLTALGRVLNVKISDETGGKSLNIRIC